MCGNKLIEGSETCDDGNSLSGDGCNSCALEPGFSCPDEECLATCGDGHWSPGETCDPTADPYCNADCSDRIGACGDGVFQAAAGEKCEVDHPGCKQCKIAFSYVSCDAVECIQSGLDGDLRFGDLTDSQLRKYCNWAVRIMGGEGTIHECSGVEYYIYEPFECELEYRKSAYDNCTVGEFDEWFAGRTLCGVLTETQNIACAVSP